MGCVVLGKMNSFCDSLIVYEQRMRLAYKIYREIHESGRFEHQNEFDVHNELDDDPRMQLKDLRRNIADLGLSLELNHEDVLYHRVLNPAEETVANLDTSFLECSSNEPS